MESRVVSFGGQCHTEMKQAENGSAGMCGSMLRIGCDLMFP